MAVWVCAGVFWSDLKSFASLLDLHGAASKTRSENSQKLSFMILILHSPGFEYELDRASVNLSFYVRS